MLQTPGIQQNIFSAQKITSTFSLSALLANDRLTIKLDDYVEWVTYEKTYTDQDIGKQIHRKLELIDVFSCFSEAQKLNDQTNTQVKDKKETDTMDYIFGCIIKHNGKPRYKIQLGGKVTTYTQVTFRRNNEQVQQTFESNLNLIKIQKMSQLQILMAKSSTQKKELIAKFQNKIEKIFIQNMDLKQRVTLLQHKNNKLQQKYEITSNMLYRMEKQQKEQRQMNILLKQQIQNIKKLNDFVKLDTSAAFYHKFSVNQNYITYIGQNNNFTQFFIKQAIAYNKTYKFKFRIVRSVSKNIFIGICQIQKQKSVRSSYSSSNAFALYGPGNGYKYPDGTVQGKGYQQNDIVQVVVNLADKSITWNLNGTYNSSFVNRDPLGDSSRKFFPYVELYETNQCIQWLGSS